MRDRKSRPTVFQEVFGDDMLVLSSRATTDDTRQWNPYKIVHDEYTWIS
jgi:hypothetical protein